MKGIGTAVGVALAAWLLASGSVRAGTSLEAPGATNSAASAMWTLDAIYSVLDTRATNVTKRTTVVNEPTNGPTAGTMHTLNDIMGLVTNRAPVPKTGQVNSFVARDDGALRMGVTWPNPRFAMVGAAGSDATNQIRDNLTGLIWARNANLFGTTNWGGAVSNCNALVYGGTNDWRLPNVRELYSLIDPSPWNSPQLPSGYSTFFSNVQGDYWSSTVPHINDTYPVKVSIWYGEMVRFDRATAFSVWPVRGGAR